MANSTLTDESEIVGKYTMFLRTNSFSAQRRTIILVHGIGVSSRYFIPLATELAKTCNVIAVDFPGYGNSSKPQQPLTVHELSLVLEQFILQRKIKNSVLVGHSMGCQIIANLLARSTAICAGAILLSPTVYKEERSVSLQAFRLLQNSFFESMKTNFLMIADYLRMGPGRYAKTSHYMVHDAIEDSLKKVTAPTLLVRGSKDPIVPSSWVHYLTSLADTISMKQVEAAPHALHHKHPQRVATLCNKFIETISVRTPKLEDTPLNSRHQ